MEYLETNRGGFFSLVTIAFRNIWRNGRRTALCISAVAIAVFFNIFMQAWIVGMYDSIEDVVRTFETGHINVVTEEYEEDKEYTPVQFPVAGGRSIRELETELMEIPGVRAVLPRISTYASLFDSTVKHALLWGIDAEAELEVNNFNLTKRDDGMAEGRFPATGANECAVGFEFARKTGLGIGDTVPLKTVSAQFSDKYWNPEIVGIFDFDYAKYDEDVILVSIDRLRRILVLDEGSQQLFIYTEDPEAAAPVRDAVADMLGEGHVVRVWTDNYWVAWLRQSVFLYVIIFAVFQIVASFLIINTVLMIIHERIKEIGMMGALGLTRGEIVMVFFLEAVFLSVLGAAIGSMVGGVVTLLASWFPIDMNAFTGGGMKEMPVSGTLFITFSPLILLQGFLFGVTVSAICTLIPSLRSAFIKPVEALRR